MAEYDLVLLINPLAVFLKSSITTPNPLVFDAGVEDNSGGHLAFGYRVLRTLCGKMGGFQLPDGPCVTAKDVVLLLVPHRCDGARRMASVSTTFETVLY